MVAAFEVGGLWGQLIVEPAWLEEFIKLPHQLAYEPNYHINPTHQN